MPLKRPKDLKKYIKISRRSCSSVKMWSTGIFTIGIRLLQPWRVRTSRIVKKLNWEVVLRSETRCIRSNCSTEFIHITKLHKYKKKDEENVVSMEDEEVCKR